MLILRQVESSGQIILGSIVSLPASELEGIDTGKCEKFAITAKHSVGLEEEMTPSINMTLSGKAEDDSISPWEKGLGAVSLICVSEYGCNTTFLVVRAAKEVGLECPKVIVCRPVSMEMSALESKSMPIIQGTCRLSIKVKCANNQFSQVNIGDCSFRSWLTLCLLHHII